MNLQFFKIRYIIQIQVLEIKYTNSKKIKYADMNIFYLSIENAYMSKDSTFRQSPLAAIFNI